MKCSYAIRLFLMQMRLARVFVETKLGFGRGLRVLILAASPVFLFCVCDWLAPLPVESLHPPSSTVVLDRNGRLLRAFLAPDDMWRIRTSADEISPNLKKAVLAYEDHYFYRHPGINPIAIVRAALANLRAGHVVQGGSTITMQVARLMQPKERTFANKLLEAFRALQLEWHFSKAEILTFYFNLAPYGGNIVGAAAASRFYFNKSPEQLSLGEAALLAAIPNSPNHFRPDLNFRGAGQARAKVLSILASQGKISAQAEKEALWEPIPDKRYDLPFLVPHLSTDLKQRQAATERLETTIDGAIQEMADGILRMHMKPLNGRGISNGAVVIIENASREVLALVGSADFFDEVHSGQVNGALAPRSPGSALKPFIYALGIENGLITPRTLLSDVPVEYSGYEPENYDGLYHGAVSVEEALVHSLNVPAVNLYAQLGEKGIYSFLKDAGVTTLPNPREHYGLSLILGGCEVTLLELTNLYAGLANGGQFASYRILKSQKESLSKRLFRPATCYILTELLSKLRRPELPAIWESSIDIPKVAWKTGTSYGHRDAWSIGYTPKYTVGVWVGNFDGKGVPELVGAEAAAPILFALFDALKKTSDSRWFVQPAGVEKRQVCSVSGMPASMYCTAVNEELYIPGISPYRPCDIHRLVLIDRETGKRLCSHCRKGRSYEERIVEQWPAEIATWMARNGHPVDPIPPHFPNCSKTVAGAGPQIHSPAPNTIYKIRRDVGLEYQKILFDVSVSNRTQTIYWFLDGKLFSAGNPNEKVFFIPERGRHVLLCVDDEGRSSETRFVVN